MIEFLLGSRATAMGDEKVHHGVGESVCRFNSDQRLEVVGFVAGLFGEFASSRGLEVVVIGFGAANRETAVDSRNGLTPFVDADDVAVGRKRRMQTLAGSET